MSDIRPIRGNFGADVLGVDLNTINDADFDIIYQAWLDYGVLRIRGQQLDEDGLQQFSERFGPLEEMPYGRLSEELKKKIKNIYVTVISNIIENGRPIGGLGSSEATWHSDMTYVKTPPPASVLLGVEIPPAGGDTWFANQYAAYEALPEALKKRIENLSIKHDAAHNSVGKLRPGFASSGTPEQAPGAIHPIIRSHNETGKKCIYLGRREWAYVVGLSPSESESLLDELWQYAAMAENTIKHQWQPGDVIIWDNRCVLHRGMPYDADRYRRRMHQTRVAGLCSSLDEG